MQRKFNYESKSDVARHIAKALPLFLGLIGYATQCQAQIDLGPVTVGAGLQTSFVHTGATPDAGSTDQVLLNSVRLYVNGTASENIKYMFNTEYDSVTNKVGVLDAVAEFSGSSPKVNIWVGRFLPPSDRANLYGPYYSNEWAVYTDGIQDGYPFVYNGRDNGIMYWGDFGKKLKVSVGAFDGKTATGDYKLLGAARVQIDFWDKEDGYYLNGTYYGDKNLLSIGGATQFQSGNTATTADFLLEKKLHNQGVVTVESEYSYYDGLGGYNPVFRKSQGAYALGSYLFPKVVPIAGFKGKFEVLGKFAKADYSHGTVGNYNQKTTEVNLDYVIKQFKARIQTFYKDTRFNRLEPNFWQLGVGFQVQI